MRVKRMRRLEVQGFLFRECDNGIDEFHGGAVWGDERILHYTGVVMKCIDTF